MTKKDTMAKLPGLFKREGVYQLRVMIPKDLQGAYGGRTKLVESLGITSTAAAKTIGTAQRAARLEEFDQKRRELNPQQVDKITPELAQVLAQRVASVLLETDERLRTDPAAARQLLSVLRAAAPSKLTIRPGPLPFAAGAPTSALEGITSELAAELARVNAGMDAHSALQMATQRAAAVLPMAKAEGRKLGLVFDENTPGALPALRECLKAYRRAWQDIARRDQGEVIETPTAPTTVQANQARHVRLRDVLPQWKASKARKPQTEKAAEKALGMGGTGPGRDR